MISLYRYHKISDLARMLSAEPSDSSAPVYMLPSRANEETLLDMLRTDGRYFGERPLVWSWAEMYRALVPRTDLRRQIDPPDHRLLLKFVIRQNLAELAERGVDVPNGVRRSGFVDILSSAIRELLLEGVPPDLLLGGARGETGELLYRLYSDYLLYLEGHGLADNSQLPTLIRSSVESGRSRLAELSPRILWVGFMSLTGAQLKLARALADAGVEMVFFVPDAGLAAFHDLGAQLGLDARSAPERSLHVESLTGDDPYDQYERLAPRIARFFADDAGGGLPDIGVLVPGGAMQLVASALNARGVPVQSRAEIPVAETAIIDALRAAWTCYERGWPYARTLALLRSPLFALQLDENFIRKTIPEGADSWRRALSDQCQPTGASEAFEQLTTFCAHLDDPQGHTAEELLRALIDLVRAAGDGWDIRLSRLARDDAELDAAVREVASAAVEISEKLEMLAELTPPLGEAGAVRFSGADAVSFLVEWSRESTTALASPRIGAVTLYDAYPPVLASHKIWAMADVDPSNFPGPSADHLLLDGEVRSGINASQEEWAEGVHLPTLHEKREQSEAVFRRLLATGERLTIVSRSLTDRQGRQQNESPFLRACLAEGGYYFVEPSDEKNIPSEVRRIDRGVFPRVASMPPGSAKKIRISVSHIDEWRACPFFYWCARVARLERPTDISEVFGRIEQGNLLHEIWQGVWERYLANGAAPAGKTLHGTLLASWYEILERLRAANALLSDARSAPAVSGLRSRMLDVAAACDEIEARARANGIVRAGADYEFKLPEFELENAIFVGRADRVDRWDGLGSVLVDYKLGSAAALRGSLQLACYAAMAQAGGLDVAGYCYISHADARVTGVWSDEAAGIYRQKRGRTTAGLDERIEEARSAMREMDEAVGAGLFPARVDSPLCQRCVYQTVCRRGERFGAFAPQEMGEESEDEARDD